MGLLDSGPLRDWLRFASIYSRQLGNLLECTEGSKEYQIQDLWRLDLIVDLSVVLP